MTRLFIDGQEVVLSENFELELITENPYFTRNGEYTYDIDIDLRDAHNRSIYQNINRSDVTKGIKNRKATLMSGALEIISGMEVVLSIENYTAKIQIVAGNSQLNYEGGDTNIRSMLLDGISMSSQEAVNTLFGNFPEYKVVYPPIVNYTESNGDMSILNNVQVGEDISFTDVENISPQYYLLYVIENLITKLGFTKGVNELEDDPVWSRLFIVNPYKDSILQELLPDWTINEFIEQIELFLDCIISIDKVNGRFNIISLNKYFENQDIVYLDNVIDDSVEKTFDVDTNYAFAYKYVSYDLPSDKYYNYLKLKDGVRENCSIVSSPEWDDFQTQYEQYYSGPYILHSDDYGLDYVVTDYSVSGETKKGLIIVDRFKDAGDLDSRDKSSFQIVPAEIEKISIYSVTGGRYLIGPAVKKLKTDPGSNAINDLINSSEVKSDIPDKLYVGIYYGIQKALNRGPNEFPGEYWDKMPMGSNDRYFIQEPTTLGGNQAILTLPDYTITLDGDNGLFNRIYKNKREIDTSVEYTFQFLTNTVYKLDRIFVIRNKRYYCKEIRYKITPKGMDKIAEGVFYLAE
jgi:hypothetical protein